MFAIPTRHRLSLNSAEAMGETLRVSHTRTHTRRRWSKFLRTSGLLRGDGTAAAVISAGEGGGGEGSAGDADGVLRGKFYCQLHFSCTQRMREAWKTICIGRRMALRRQTAGAGWHQPRWRWLTAKRVMSLVGSDTRHGAGWQRHASCR